MYYQPLSYVCVLSNQRKGEKYIEQFPAHCLHLRGAPRRRLLRQRVQGPRQDRNPRGGRRQVRSQIPALQGRGRQYHHRNLATETPQASAHRRNEGMFNTTQSLLTHHKNVNFLSICISIPDFTIHCDFPTVEHPPRTSRGTPTTSTSSWTTTAEGTSPGSSRAGASSPRTWPGSSSSSWLWRSGILRHFITSRVFLELFCNALSWLTGSVQIVRFVTRVRNGCRLSPWPRKCSQAKENKVGAIAVYSLSIFKII